MNATKTHIERAVLMPSIGDDVLFRLNGQKLTVPALATVDDQPLHAKVCYVWSPYLVNLLVVDHYGNTHQLTSVNFVAPGGEIPMIGAYCELEVILGECIEGVAATTAPAQTAERQEPIKRSLSQADIEAEIAAEFYCTAAEGVLGESEMGTSPAHWTGLDQVTFCILVLKNKTKVVGINYGSINPDVHDTARGRTEARAHAIDQVWQLMGYELRSKLMQRG